MFQLKNHFPGMFTSIGGSASTEDDVQRLARVISDNTLDVERHPVKTPDSAVLTMHRVVPRLPTGQTRPAPKGVVILQAGITETSITWIFNGGKESLAARLVDAGLDVWLGNNRGTPFADLSGMTKKERDAWSFEDMAQYDFPSMLNYVCEKTGAEKVTVLGQSQGGTQVLGAISTNPHLNSKINKIVLLAPGIVFRNAKDINILTRLTATTFCSFPFLAWFAQCYLHFLQAISSNFLRAAVGPFIMKLLGFYFEDIGGDIEAKGMLFRNIGAGFQSPHNMRHWAQLIEEGRPIGLYQNDDTVPIIKLIRRHSNIVFEQVTKAATTSYSSNLQYDYPLHNITVPVDAYLAGRDNLFDPEAEEAYLLFNLGSRCRICTVPEFGHLDFSYGKDRPKDFFPELTELVVNSCDDGKSVEEIHITNSDGSSFSADNIDEKNINIVKDNNTSKAQVNNSQSNIKFHQDHDKSMAAFKMNMDIESVNGSSISTNESIDDFYNTHRIQRSRHSFTAMTPINVPEQFFKGPHTQFIFETSADTDSSSSDISISSDSDDDYSSRRRGDKKDDEKAGKAVRFEEATTCGNASVSNSSIDGLSNLSSSNKSSATYSRRNSRLMTGCAAVLSRTTDRASSYETSSDNNSRRSRRLRTHSHCTLRSRVTANGATQYLLPTFSG